MSKLKNKYNRVGSDASQLQKFADEVCDNFSNEEGKWIKPEEGNGSCIITGSFETDESIVYLVLPNVNPIKSDKIYTAVHCLKCKEGTILEEVYLIIDFQNQTITDQEVIANLDTVALEGFNPVTGERIEYWEF